MKFTGYLNSQKIRYLLAGIWNTLFGYFLGVGVYVWIGHKIHIILISIFCNVIAISMAFLAYKLFVFRTPGEWIGEYLKMYLAYGFTAIIGILLTWVFVDLLDINIWITQAIVLIFLFIISFFLNKNFTFKGSKD